jgi:hypothetical protein
MRIVRCKIVEPSMDKIGLKSTGPRKTWGDRQEEKCQGKPAGESFHDSLFQENAEFQHGFGGEKAQSDTPALNPSEEIFSILSSLSGVLTPRMIRGP